MKKNTKSKHITKEIRILIERKWNKMIDSRKHLSIRVIAKHLGIPESTLRYELKRGCSGGCICMYLPSEKRYQYFPYNAEWAQQTATQKASNKGVRMKITNTFIAAFTPYLEEWSSIPAAHKYFKQDFREWKGKIPSVSTLYNHVTTTLAAYKIFEKYYRSYKPKRKIKDVEPAKNHDPEFKIDHLSEEIKTQKPEGYFQMDLVVSGRNGKGGLLVLANPGQKKNVFIRKLNDLRRITVHRALRSIVAECKKLEIQITHILTDNGSEFTDTKKLSKITNAMIFYTHAYAAWEKGSIENTNRIIRRFYPKKTDFSKLRHKDIATLQYKLMNYPRPSTTKKELVA